MNSKINNRYCVEQKQNWDNYTKFIEEKQSTLKNCIFRGQRNPKWSLEPTLYRLITNITDRDQIIRLSDLHLESFKKNTRMRHTISYTDPNDSEDNWWALGQHYGLATPLLDWVYSPYVAAFFSFREADNNGQDSRSIHILNIEQIKRVLEEHNRSEKQINSIRIIDPLMHENQRLVSQGGIFTFIEDSNQYSNYFCIEDYLNTFVDRFKDYIGKEILYYKIIIPSNERAMILAHLNLMNINESTLFPDLGGAASYCNYLLEGQLGE